jgi:hypothetical protein
MTKKCIKMLTMVKMKLFILILKVQTNDLAPTSFSHFSLLIQYVHSSKLDGVDEQLYTCFADWLRHCRHNLPHNDHFYRGCIDLGVTICLFQTIKEGEKGFPLSKCFIECQKHKDPSVSTMSCYSVCLGRHISGSNVVYLHNYTQLKAC